MVELDFVVHDIDDVALRTVVDTLFDDSRSLTSLPHAAQRPWRTPQASWRSDIIVQC